MPPNLLRQRGYIALSLGTIVLAVGANLVVFTIVNALWLRPRPVADPERVVMVMGDAGSTGASETFWFAESGLQRVREVPAFEQVAGQVMTSGVNAALKPVVVFDAAGRAVETLGVTSEYFAVLGVAVRGRDFTRQDDRYGAAPVAVISDRLWRTAFGGQPDAIGRIWPASPFPIQIVGVAPVGFHGARLGEQADLWVPRNLVPRVSSVPTLPDGSQGLPEGTTPVLALGRLRPGVTVAEAQRLIARYASSDDRGLAARLTVVPLSRVYGSPDHRTLIIDESRVLRVIAATSLLVLIGGCATLMSLVLVHYERRRHELAVRLALGASRGRLVRRLALELTWLVSAGSGGALLMAGWATQALPALDLPGGVSLARLDASIDWRVALAGVAASAATVALAASLPLLRFTHAGVARHLISPTATTAAGSLRLRKVMLGIHVAATVVVLVSASLFVRTIQYGFNTGAGFDVDRTLFVSVDVGTMFDFATAAAQEAGSSGTVTPQQSERLLALLHERRSIASQRVLDRFATLPGVDVMALGPAPIGPDQAAVLARPTLIQSEGIQRVMPVGTMRVGPGYLEALGVQVIEGRGLTGAYIPATQMPQHAVVTAALAEALWPGQTALGRRIRIGSSPAALEIVGVAENFAIGSMRFESPAAILIVAGSELLAANTLTLSIRASQPERLAEPIRRLVASVTPGNPRVTTISGRDLVAADLGRERLGAWFFSGFGIVAVVLGVGGVFGLIAYLAESRRREFGVRLALGATSWDLLRTAVNAGLVPTVAGAAVGLLGAAWLAQTAEAFLIGVGRLDAVSYIGAFSLIVAVGTIAGVAAAWRVRDVSPIEALRAE